MSEAETAPRRRLLPYAVLGLVGLIGGLVAIYGMDGVKRNAADAGVCRAAAVKAAHLGPHAQGEVAAFTPTLTPKAMPDLSFVGENGEAVRLSAFRGKTVLLNLWATWCVPCRKEMPALDALQSTLGGREFTVLALNIDTRDPLKPKVWLKDTGIQNLGYFADSTGKVFQELKQGGKMLGLPTTILIDANGCELGVMQGPAEWASPDALRLLREALKKG